MALSAQVIATILAVCSSTASARVLQPRLDISDIASKIDNFDIGNLDIPTSLVGSPYTPVQVACPASPLVRPATSASTSEATWVSERSCKADAGLAAWLKKIDSDFDTSSLPEVGLTTSGGGYRSLLNGAGVVQAFDDRDSDSDVSGLYQGLTYHAGLSGGGWLLSSIAGNNWTTISNLRDSLWEDAFQDSPILPSNYTAGIAYAEILIELDSKNDAGFPTTIVDPYGRLLSYQLLLGPLGGVSTTMSGLAQADNFTNHNVPFPIITSIYVDPDQCDPMNNNTQFEFTPYEFGSWETGVKAFTQTEYLGSELSNGMPVTPNTCITNYDNLGYVLGTSSDIWAGFCEVFPANISSAELPEQYEAMIATAHDPALQDIYALYRNPFANYSGSPEVSSLSELHLVDGGLSNQNNPIWPFIQPYRNVSVLVVNDNSADTADNFPNGTEIYNTYLQAQANNLTKMPVIPDVSTFVSRGLNKRATFFGCNDTDVLTIVYLPNVNYTYASNVPTSQIVYSKDETDGVIGNGNAIATQNGTQGWPMCFGCAVLMKTNSSLPSGCQGCFDEYCYKA
ncbi:hypothetical protein MBLNU457_6343t1 [Dothideomycetes sp. NU457]